MTTAIYSRKIVAMTGLLALPFGLAAGGGIAAWNAVLVALLRRYHQRFPKAVLQWAIRGMGLVLIVIALWSAVDLVRKGLSPAG